MEEDTTITTIFEDIENAESIEEAAAYAIGAASVCWDTVPEGIFDAERAALVLDALHNRIEKG